MIRASGFTCRSCHVIRGASSAIVNGKNHPLLLPTGRSTNSRHLLIEVGGDYTLLLAHVTDGSPALANQRLEGRPWDLPASSVSTQVFAKDV